MFKRIIYVVISIFLSFAFTFSAFPQSNKIQTSIPNIRLKANKVLGNRCVIMAINEVKPWNDVGVTVSLRIKNNCGKDQLVNAMVAFPRQLFSFMNWSPGSMSREIWPEDKPYPARFRFVPIIQLQSGFVISSGMTVTTEMTSTNMEGLNPISFRLGACDRFKAGKIQAVFHDANLQTNFECYPIPGSRTLAPKEEDVELEEPEAEPHIDFKRKECLPEYPRQSLRNEEQGESLLRLEINKAGDIIDVKVIPRDVPRWKNLDDAVIATLLQGRCKASWTEGKKSRESYFIRVSYIWKLY